MVMHQQPGRPGGAGGHRRRAAVDRRAAPTGRPRAAPAGEERFDPPGRPVDAVTARPADDASTRSTCRWTAPAAHADRCRLDRPELDEAIFRVRPGRPRAAEPEELAAPISGVGLTLLVTDLSRSLDFYRDMLGFDGGRPGLRQRRARLRDDPPGAARGDRGGTDQPPAGARQPGGGRHRGGLRAAARHRRAASRTRPGCVNRGTKLEVWAAAFRDPDGHGIALTQWRNAPRPDRPLPAGARQPRMTRRTCSAYAHTRAKMTPRREQRPVQQAGEQQQPLQHGAG